MTIFGSVTGVCFLFVSKTGNKLWTRPILPYYITVLPQIITFVPSHTCSFNTPSAIFCDQGIMVIVSFNINILLNVTYQDSLVGYKCIFVIIVTVM